MAFDFSSMENPAPQQEKHPATWNHKFHAPLDIEGAKAAFEPYREKIAEMQQQADVLAVDSDESQDIAVESAAQSRRLLKALDEERKRVIQDADQFVRGINAFVRTFKKPLDGMVNTLRKKIGDYQYQAELERRKAQKRMEEEVARLAAKAQAEAEKEGIEPPPPMPAPVIKADTITRTESGASASIRTQWVGEIEDPEKVPRRFCTPDQKKINEAVKLGVRAIEGVKIFERPITVLRS